MMSRSRCLLLISLFLPFVALLPAQDSTASSSRHSSSGGFSLSFGASAGNFAIDAENFNNVYSNRSVSRIYFAGIGTSSVLVIAKYRENFAHGTSKTENIIVTGKAEWKQRFYAAGLRFHGDDHPIYVDLLYVVTRAEESITTIDPVVENLTSTYAAENKGAGVAVGILFNIIGPIGIHVEGEYTLMTRKGRNALGRVNPELGGACASAGVNFTI